MVSGLVTSPCDQLRIFSGDARLMRIASKSAIGFAMSKGLERYKVFLHFLLSQQLLVPSTKYLVTHCQFTFISLRAMDSRTFLSNPVCQVSRVSWHRATRYSVLGTELIRCGGDRL